MGKFGEIDSADMRAGKFPLVPMGGWAEGPACADTGARTPIGASGILKVEYLSNHWLDLPQILNYVNYEFLGEN